MKIKNTLKNTLRIASLGALAFIAGGTNSLYNFSPKTASFYDVDEDGKDDIVISTRGVKAAYIFLDRDGEYVKLEYLPKDDRVKTQDKKAELNCYNLER